MYIFFFFSLYIFFEIIKYHLGIYVLLDSMHLQDKISEIFLIYNH